MIGLKNLRTVSEDSMDQTIELLNLKSRVDNLLFRSVIDIIEVLFKVKGFVLLRAVIGVKQNFLS